MNILLCELPVFDELREYSLSKRENLGLEYIASTLKEEDYQVQLLSAPAEGLNNQQSLERIEACNPDLICISLPFSDEMENSLQMLPMIRDTIGSRPHLCLGGHAATASCNPILENFPEVDSIVMGEGEQTITVLADELNKGGDWESISGISLQKSGFVIHNESRPLTHNLDSFPFPDRELFEKSYSRDEKNQIYMAGSRGCYARCTFCDIKAFYKNGSRSGWRGRSNENIINEIKELKNKYGNSVYFTFVDDQFIGPGRKGYEKAFDFGEKIIQESLDIEFEITCRADNIDYDLMAHLKKAGLTSAYLGIDSGSQKILDLFKKGLTVEQNLNAIEILLELELNCDYGFIMFDPRMTIEDLEENCLFLKRVFKLGQFVPPDVFANTLKPYPKTPVIQEIGIEDEINSRLKGFEFEDSAYKDSRVLEMKNFINNYWNEKKPRHKDLEKALTNTNNTSLARSISSELFTESYKILNLLLKKIYRLNHISSINY